MPTTSPPVPVVPKNILDKLKTIACANAEEFLLFNNEYGEYLGKHCKDFISKNEIKVDFIASHGHTIFHQPSEKFTSQIGSGASIAAKSGVTCVSDFRT